MSIEIKVPRLGWSMEEGTFVGWLKNEGDLVRAGDVLFAFEGDKSTQEVESFDEGILSFLEQGPTPGTIVLVGQVIGLLRPVSEMAETQRPRVDEPPLPLAASPRARRRARELGIDWTGLQGSGSSGRIRERDVIAARQVAPVPVEPPGAFETPLVRPHSPLRRVIAQRMAESQRQTASVTLTSEVDATNLVLLREQFRSTNPENVPSYNDFIAKLTAQVLRQHPQLNAQWQEDALLLLPYIHIGIAVDTDAGLVVPVIPHADRLSLREVSAKTRELVQQSRSIKAFPTQSHSATFTLTNLGAFGIDAFTPIINPPQVAILGLGRIRRRPTWVDKKWAGRDLMVLSLTFDHRAVDGGPAARFLQSVGQSIENPAERLIS